MDEFLSVASERKWDEQDQLAVLSAFIEHLNLASNGTVIEELIDFAYGFELNQ